MSEIEDQGGRGDPWTGLREQVREAARAARPRTHPGAQAAAGLGGHPVPAHGPVERQLHGQRPRRRDHEADRHRRRDAASRHAGGPVVTASLDQMSFLHPVHVGDVVLVRASVNDVGRTSIEVGVRVEAEEILSGRRTHTSSAYLVFVALDERGQPRPVPGLAPEDDLERHRQAEAKIRREHRLATAEAIRRRRDQLDS